MVRLSCLRRGDESGGRGGAAQRAVGERTDVGQQAEMGEGVDVPAVRKYAGAGAGTTARSTKAPMRIEGHAGVRACTCSGRVCRGGTRDASAWMYPVSLPNAIYALE